MPDQEFQIRQLTRADLPVVARWHAREFPDGFYPQLGHRFLIAYYGTYLNSPYAVALAAVGNEGTVAGYLTGTLDERRHGRRVLVRHCVRLMIVGLFALLQRPRLLRDFVRRRASWYLRRLARAILDAVTPRPAVPQGELVYVVTAEHLRGQGIGAQLLDEFRRRAAQAGTGELRLVTAADEPRLDTFYRRHGWLPAERRTTRDGRELASFRLPLPIPQPAPIDNPLRSRPRLHWTFATVTTVTAFAVACSAHTETAYTPTPSDKPAAETVSPTPAPSPSRPATPSPSPTATRPVTADPVIRPIPAYQWKRMVATGTWRPGCPVGQTDLRRVEVNHYDFSGRVRRGVVVVHRDTAVEIAAVFTELFKARFPIRQLRPVEEYGGDNTASMAADNTAAYNCRRPNQINAPVLKSPHANGRAIDINPVENPWIDLRCKCWQPSATSRARRPAPGVITKGSAVWTLFTTRGWKWQNIDTPDYMHFDTGYPSAPLARRPAR